MDYTYTHLAAVARTGMIGNRIGQLEAEILTRQITLAELAAVVEDDEELAKAAAPHHTEVASLVQRIDALRAMLTEHGGGDAPAGDHHEGGPNGHHERAHALAP